MSRDIDSAWLTAQHVRLALFAEVEFKTGTTRLWTGPGAFTWDGHDWTGAGNLLSVASAEETLELRATGIRLQLNGCNPDILAAVLTDILQGKPVNVWLGFFDTSAAAWQLISDSRNPYKLFGGGVDASSFSFGADALTVTLTAESELIRLQQAPGRRYTSEDQKREFPDDKGFDYVTALLGESSPWGAGTTGVGRKQYVDPAVNATISEGGG